MTNTTDVNLLKALAEEGCSDDCMRNRALMVYHYLKNVKEWRNVNMKYCNRLNVIYLIGNNRENEEITVVPRDSSEVLTADSLGELFSLHENQNHRVTLALCSGEGTIVCYDFGDQLQDL